MTKSTDEVMVSCRLVFCLTPEMFLCKNENEKTIFAILDRVEEKCVKPTVFIVI